MPLLTGFSCPHCGIRNPWEMVLLKGDRVKCTACKGIVEVTHIDHTFGAIRVKPINDTHR